MPLFTRALIFSFKLFKIIVNKTYDLTAFLIFVNNRLGISCGIKFKKLISIKEFSADSGLKQKDHLSTPAIPLTNKQETTNDKTLPIKIRIIGLDEYLLKYARAEVKIIIRKYPTIKDFEKSRYIEQKAKGKQYKHKY